MGLPLPGNVTGINCRGLFDLWVLLPAQPGVPQGDPSSEQQLLPPPAHPALGSAGIAPLRKPQPPKTAKSKSGLERGSWSEKLDQLLVLGRGEALGVFEQNPRKAENAAGQRGGEIAAGIRGRSEPGGLGGCRAGGGAGPEGTAAIPGWVWGLHPPLTPALLESLTSLQEL